MGALKYILATLGAAAVCIGIGYLAVRLITRKRTKRPSRLRTATLSLLIGIALAGIAGFAYVENYLHATPTAHEALNSTATVTVSHENGAYAFDGPGTSTALVFYPGGKVEAAAYAPLMQRLADEGIDCFLAEMPFRLAFFNANAAEAIVANHAYDHWIVAGHSLGGAFAANYASTHPDSVESVVLLAAYPTKPMDSSQQLCIVYGSEDGCLDFDAYDSSRELWPPNSAETVIAGGNHAQFGDYGHQPGDGSATISADDQQAQTVRAISALVK